MKILLASGNKVTHDLPPLGVLYVAAVLRKNCPEHELLVLDHLPSLDEVLNYEPDVICFGALTVHMTNIIDLCQQIKCSKDIPIILGGIHISTLLRLPSCCDIGVLGEGEKIIVDLIKVYEVSRKPSSTDLMKIPNLIFHQGNHQVTTQVTAAIRNLDKLPYPARDLIDMERYLRPINWFGHEIGRGSVMITSRGCPYSCDFCSSSKFWGRHFRGHSAQYVINEIEHLIDKYGVELVFIADDNFLINRARLKQIAGLIQERSIHVRMGILGRLDNFSEDVADILIQMGVVDVSFGYETGSSRIASDLKSSWTLSLEEARRITQLAVDKGFSVTGMFMICSPGESEEDIRQTFDYIDSLPLSKLGIAIATPFPGTEWWDLAIRQGVIDPNSDIDWSKYNLKYWFDGRPVFKDTVTPSQLKYLWEELQQKSSTLWAWSWERRQQMLSDGLTAP